MTSRSSSSSSPTAVDLIRVDGVNVRLSRCFSKKNKKFNFNTSHHCENENEEFHFNTSYGCENEAGPVQGFK